MFATREVVRIHKFRIAVRLHYGDLDKETISEEIDSLLSVLGIAHSEADLFVDCGVIDDLSPDYGWLCGRTPRLLTWRRFIVTGGSFPENLEGMAVGARIRARYDWLQWEAWALTPKLQSARTPDFSDYTIQHAVYEPRDGGRASASIRYTADKYWMIMRGEAPSERNAGSRQYFGNAQLLCEREEFRGAPYSFGDGYVSAVANRQSGPGTPTTWLTAGINHHMTLATRQVASVHE